MERTSEDENGQRERSGDATMVLDVLGNAGTGGTRARKFDSKRGRAGCSSLPLNVQSACLPGQPFPFLGCKHCAALRDRGGCRGASKHADKASESPSVSSRGQDVREILCSYSKGSDLPLSETGANAVWLPCPRWTT